MDRHIKSFAIFSVFCCGGIYWKPATIRFHFNGIIYYHLNPTNWLAYRWYLEKTSLVEFVYCVCFYRFWFSIDRIKWIHQFSQGAGYTCLQFRWHWSYNIKHDGTCFAWTHRKERAEPPPSHCLLFLGAHYGQHSKSHISFNWHESLPYLDNNFPSFMDHGISNICHHLFTHAHQTTHWWPVRLALTIGF